MYDQPMCGWWHKISLFGNTSRPLLQVRLEEAQTKHAAAAAEASSAKQKLADKELLLLAAAPANGDVGEEAVSRPSMLS